MLKLLKLILMIVLSIIVAPYVVVRNSIIITVETTPLLLTIILEVFEWVVGTIVKGIRSTLLSVVKFN